MSVIQFESVVEGDIIRIPKQYLSQIPYIVAVTLVDVEKSQFKTETTKEFPSIDEFPAVLDTRGWKFNREEANERR